MVKWTKKEIKAAQDAVQGALLYRANGDPRSYSLLASDGRSLAQEQEKLRNERSVELTISYLEHLVGIANTYVKKKRDFVAWITSEAGAKVYPKDDTRKELQERFEASAKDWLKKARWYRALAIKIRLNGMPS